MALKLYASMQTACSDYRSFVSMAKHVACSAELEFLEQLAQ